MVVCVKNPVHLRDPQVFEVIEDFSDELKEAGLWIIGTASDGNKVIYEADFKGPIAVVIGNEGKGIRRLVREKCDFLVKIPLYGKLDSLNASVAGALVMFEAARVRHSR